MTQTVPPTTDNAQPQQFMLFDLGETIAPPAPAEPPPQLEATPPAAARSNKRSQRPAAKTSTQPTPAAPVRLEITPALELPELPPLQLAAVRAASAEALPEEPAEPAPLSFNVLVVDDEPDIAAMVAEMLRQDGHVAEIARDARTALDIVERADVDLIVSDLRMADLDGPGLYRAVREKRPDLAERMLFITGDVLAADIDRFLAETGAAVVEKPLDPVAFRRAVAGRLAESQGESA